MYLEIIFAIKLERILLKYKSKLHLVELVCLNDLESCAGGDFGPWQI